MAAYIHLPFCKKKCYYCDFPVVALGSGLGTEQAQDSMSDYVDLLLREVAATARLNWAPLRSVFFGGGTPSLIRPALLERILEALEARFGIAAGAEISMEADPGTFDADSLRAYMRLGVTRVSVGVQVRPAGRRLAGWLAGWLCCCQRQRTEHCPAAPPPRRPFCRPSRTSCWRCAGGRTTWRTRTAR